MINITVVVPNKLTKLILQSQLDKDIFKMTFYKEIQEALDGITSKVDHPELIVVTTDVISFDKNKFTKTIRDGVNTRKSPVLLLTSENDTNKLKSYTRDYGITEILPSSDLSPLINYLYLYCNNRNTSQIKGKVLLVEDSKAEALFVIEVFKSTGIEVLHCSSAEEALLILNKQSVDLIIADFILEGKMTGLNLIQKVRSNPNFINVPILAISSLDDQVRKIEMLHAGASDFGLKPLVAEEFLVRSTNLIRNKKLFDTVVEQQKKLQKMAHTDHLTELYNRHYLIAEAIKLISLSREMKTPLSILLMDVDHFKLVNDEHGHDVGDIVLKDVAKMLMEAFSEPSVVARYGGEEFVVLLPKSNKSDAKANAELFREKLANTPINELKITMSIGVSQLRDTDESIDNLIKRADDLLYVAKESGRNCVKS